MLSVRVRRFVLSPWSATGDKRSESKRIRALQRESLKCSCDAVAAGRIVSAAAISKLADVAELLDLLSNRSKKTVRIMGSTLWLLRRLLPNDTPGPRGANATGVGAISRITPGSLIVNKGRQS